MPSYSTWILSLKVVLISSGVVGIAMVMKFSVPLIMGFAVNEVPVIWSILLSWLKPPYLYVIINAIIITIAVSSRFYQKIDRQNQLEPLVQAKPPPSDFAPVSTQPSDFAPVSTLPSDFAPVSTPPSDFAPISTLPSDLAPVSTLLSDFSPVSTPESDFAPISTTPEFGVAYSSEVYENEDQILDVKAVVVNGSEVVSDEDELEFENSRSTWTPPPQRINSKKTQARRYLYPATEKPPISSRSGHRKSVKAIPQGGRALRVAKAKRNETLENTWKAITDGRHMPLARHLRKSDTWENQGRQGNAEMVNKSETLNDHGDLDGPSEEGALALVSSSPGLSKLRKEASPSQDELNRRVEAFINKVNEEMRLQKQESLNRYTEMINRGAH